MLVLAPVLAVVGAGSRDEASWPAVVSGALVGAAWLAACVRWQLLPGASTEPYPEARRNSGGDVGARR